MGIKAMLAENPAFDALWWAHILYRQYSNEDKSINELAYLFKNMNKIRIIDNKLKESQIIEVIEQARIEPVQNSTFFYSLDPFCRMKPRNQILDNYSIDYSWVVNSSLNEVTTASFSMIENEKYDTIIKQLEDYVDKASRSGVEACKLNEIKSIFNRPAAHFHEALQRILFVNQWLWQTGHKHNGFGHLDWILYDLYRKDVESGYASKLDTEYFIKDFFTVLHDKCWFKSTMLLGDTGQIIILGGLIEAGEYKSNELTRLFIEVSKEMRLPDPKVLLRVSKFMPDDLLTLAVECISTGIGAPFLSNDDIVIPSLIQFGYEREDAFNYATSACWEPLILGKSCDQNNIRTINFCKPFVDFLDSETLYSCCSIDDVLSGYYAYLDAYIDEFLSSLDAIVFEEDPLLTLFSPEVLKTGQDIVQGGSKYANLGVTSVGISTVIDSILNLKLLVFDNQLYTLQELNRIRKDNFSNNEELRDLLDKSSSAFGEDKQPVIDLTNELIRHISNEFHGHHTMLGGNYKFGLSSPNYIVDAKAIGATLDGRKKGAPFSVHISGKNGLAPTELISFASQLDYGDNRINGNVIDFILSPDLLKENINKIVAMIKGGILKGFYQLQINVVDSKTLIDAQKNPEMFPNLVVRVWGFSAYFNDLPKEYQDNLIRRVLEAEMAC